MNWKNQSMIGVLVMGALAWPSMAVAEEGSEDEQRAALMEALELPKQTEELRRSGVSDDDIREALEVFRQPSGDEGEGGQRRAAEASRVFRSEAETAREHGPMENFGEYVRGEVEQGKRGRDLAESVRERRDGRQAPAAEEAPGRDARPDRRQRERGQQGRGDDGAQRQEQRQDRRGNRPGEAESGDEEPSDEGRSRRPANR